jgi:hypothetical protein
LSWRFFIPLCFFFAYRAITGSDATRRVARDNPENGKQMYLKRGGVNPKMQQVHIKCCTLEEHVARWKS